jgi:hypothetical protein
MDRSLGVLCVRGERAGAEFHIRQMKVPVSTNLSVEQHRYVMHSGYVLNRSFFSRLRFYVP